MSDTIKNDNNFVLYKGKPLVREGNTICYGNLTDPYILFMMIMSTKKIGDIEVPDRILVQVLSTDKTGKVPEKIYKQAEKKGLTEAFDLGIVWLDRANSGT